MQTSPSRANSCSCSMSAAYIKHGLTSSSDHSQLESPPSPQLSNIMTEISTLVRDSLHDLDKNVCFVTNHKAPASQEVSHIIAFKTDEELIAETYPNMWGLKNNFSTQTVDNLLTMSAQIHRQYDRGHCIIFPSGPELKKIWAYEESSYATPYPGYNKMAAREVVFSAPGDYQYKTLERMACDDDKHIPQADLDEMIERASKSIPGFKFVKSTQYADGIGAVHYGPPFFDFPLLRHHANPYLLIKNALRKLDRMTNATLIQAVYSMEIQLMRSIRARWSSKKANTADAGIDGGDRGEERKRVGPAAGTQGASVAPFTYSGSRRDSS